VAGNTRAHFLQQREPVVLTIISGEKSGRAAILARKCRCQQIRRKYSCHAGAPTGSHHSFPFVGPSRRKENRQQEVSEISRDLKILAKELNIPVIALSQLSRDVEQRNPPVPVLSDLRDSGAIEQDADMVMCIHRGDVFEPNTDKGAQLLVLKQRNGPTGLMRLVFHDIFARFDERAEPHQERLALQRMR
jgi:hypothetical protein